MAARFATIILALIALAAPAHATPTLPENLYYSISWNGLSLGRIRVTSSETATTYSMLVDTKSKGVAATFSPFRTLAEVQGTKTNGTYLPTRYHSRSEKSDEGGDHSTLITYDTKGAITERTLVPPNTDPAWRPIVPLKKAQTATDPITALIAMRARLSTNASQGVTDTIMRSYDGKRLAELKATIIEDDEAADRSTPVIVTRITRNPIDGYTQKELKKHAEGDPDFIVWFTNDQHLMPERLELQLMLGTIVATRESK